MTRNAKQLTVLCALAVACSAAAPAAVLAAADARTMNTVRRSAQPFTASVPCADDYYILRQLTLRNEGRNEHPQELPELPNADRGLFIGASTSLTTMTAGYVSIYEKARAALEHLADSGVLPVPASRAVYSTASRVSASGIAPLPSALRVSRSPFLR